MDDENDILDWGAEDEESKNQDVDNKHGAADSSHTQGDNQDVEDSVSLGDEEEEHEYYSYQQEEEDASAGLSETSQPNVAASASVPSTSGEVQLEDSSTFQLPLSDGGTPHRASSSGRRSPQRPLAPRITHALPPKPVVTNVPFLHPSHPSIVEATAMSVATRTAGRNETSKSKVNGSSATTGNGKAPVVVADLEPLPRGWEAREARSGPGGTYYYNVRTQESTWTRPVSSSSSSHPISGGGSRRRRGSGSFSGAEPPIPSKSDHPHYQSPETSRHSRRAQPLEKDRPIDLQSASVPDFSGMTYNDRHYRPGDTDTSVHNSGNGEDHRYTKEPIKERGRDVDPRFNPRPDKAFTPSPDTSPRARERERSLSPLGTIPSGNSRSSRRSRAPRSSRGGRHGNTDTDSSTYRERQALSNSYPTQEGWGQSNTYQESHRQTRPSYETPSEASINENRSLTLSRSGGTRARRDREQPINESRTQNMSDSRNRSPPPDKYDIRTRNVGIPQDRDYDSSRPMPQGQEEYRPVSMPDLPQPPRSVPTHKRERATRFGQPVSANTSSARIHGEQPQPQAYPQPPTQDDDPFVPDDIINRSSPQPKLEQRDFDEILSRVRAAHQAEQQVLPRHPNRERGADDESESLPVDRERLSPPPEQPTRRNRPPLPSQSAEFQGMAGRSREREREHLPRQLQDRVPSHSRQNDRNEQSPAGLRDTLRPTSDHASSINSRATYGQDRGVKDDRFYREDSPETMTAKQNVTPTTHLPAESVRSMGDEEMTKPGKEQYHQRHSIDMSHPTDARRGDVEPTGPDGYPQSSMYPPRGPRAPTSTTNTSFVNQNGPSSPVARNTLQLDPGIRNLDRSPPPHLSGRGPIRDRGEWRDNMRMSGRRDRGRSSDLSRPPPTSASGTNNVPIGSNRKIMGNGAPSGASVHMGSGPPPIGGAGQRSTRGNGNMRGRGVPPSHPSRDVQDRYGADRGDRSRNGRFESDGPRRPDTNLPPFERLAVDTAVPHDREYFSTSPRENRYEPTSTDPAYMARTWTPRGEAPPEAFVAAAGDRRPSRSPVLSREPPHVSPVIDTGRPLRFQDSYDRPGSSNVRSQTDGWPHRPGRFSRQSDEPSRGGLEGRLSDRFDDQLSTHQMHALPPNPTLLEHSMGPENIRSSEMSMRGETRRDRRKQEHVPYTPQYDSLRTLDASHQENYDPDVNLDGPPYPRSNGSHEDLGRKWNADNRPDLSRRPSSLLERMEMSVDGNETPEEASFSRSLSDRVQVPSKRDREAMNGDSYVPGDSFDGPDDMESTKRARRKPMRSRRAKTRAQ